MLSTEKNKLHRGKKEPADFSIGGLKTALPSAFQCPIAHWSRVMVKRGRDYLTPRQCTLNAMHGRQATESARLTNGLHRKQRAGVELAFGRNAVMAGHVIEIVGEH